MLVCARPPDRMRQCKRAHGSVRECVRGGGRASWRVRGEGREWHGLGPTGRASRRARLIGAPPPRNSHTRLAATATNNNAPIAPTLLARLTRWHLCHLASATLAGAAADRPLSSAPQVNAFVCLLHRCAAARCLRPCARPAVVCARRLAPAGAAADRSGRRSSPPWSGRAARESSAPANAPDTRTADETGNVQHGARQAKMGDWHPSLRAAALGWVARLTWQVVESRFISLIPPRNSPAHVPFNVTTCSSSSSPRSCTLARLRA